MFTNILVAIDGSDMSRKAFATALSMVKELGSKLSIIYVGRIIPVPDGMAIEAMEELYDAIAKAGADILNKEKDLAESQGVSADIFYSEGDPASQIITKAKEGNFDLVVIGSRGLGAFKELMLGSVSHRVSQMSPVPVLIVK